SASATLSVRANTTITTQPQDQTVYENEGTGFSIDATGTNLSFQWQSSSDGTSWTDIAGDTAETLTLSNLELNNSGTKYRVMIHSACGNSTSDVAILTVKEKEKITNVGLENTIITYDGQSHTLT